MFDNEVLKLMQLLANHCHNSIESSYFAEDEPDHDVVVTYEERLKGLIIVLEEIKAENLSQKVEVLLEKAKKELQQEQDRLFAGYQEFLKLAEIPPSYYQLTSYTNNNDLKKASCLLNETMTAQDLLLQLDEFNKKWRKFINEYHLNICYLPPLKNPTLRRAIKEALDLPADDLNPL